jgi:ADP-dependent NAD(P)H-hydrate dehydratase / NAD(P)H-hydrate epimerase
MATRAELPCELFTAAQTRSLDAAIIESGISGLELMQRAAEATWRALLRRWPEAGRLTVFCGGGNNAGDGYLVALLAQQAGWEVEVYAVAPLAGLRGDAAQAAQRAGQAGVNISPWHVDAEVGGVLLDALLGTGLEGAVRGVYCDAIEEINRAGLPVVAVDIPSGLHADRGIVQGCAVRADVTVTFIALNPGLLTAQGPDQVGELEFAGLVESRPPFELPVAERLDLARWQQVLPSRPRSAHKGMFGHLFLLGGDHGMGGAIVLAAETALRAGAGKVTVLTRSEHVPAILARCPEIMARGVDQQDGDLTPLEQATAVVVGPGLGRAVWGRRLLDAALDSGRPCVLDADALNMLAESGVPAPLGRHRVLTPHPAEAGRLLGCDAASVQADRIDACRRLVTGFGCTLILKGVGSLVASPGEGGAGTALALCSDGNPGMAVAGMGDVLSGLIGALLAQGLESAQAARYAVLVHALAGDVAAASGQRGVLASDLIAPIRMILNGGSVDGSALPD